MARKFNFSMVLSKVLRVLLFTFALFSLFQLLGCSSGFDAEKFNQKREEIQQFQGRISAEDDKLIAVKNDGTAVVNSEDENVKEEVMQWKNLKEVTARGFCDFTGLDEAGHVLCAGEGSNKYLDEIKALTNVRHIYGIGSHLICLMYDNNLKVFGGISEKNKSYIESLTDVEKLCMATNKDGGYYILTIDGSPRIPSVSALEKFDYVREFENETNISKLVLETSFDAGLKDERVAISESPYGTTKLSDAYKWDGLVDIFSGEDILIGIFSNGTVKIDGNYRQALKEVEKLTNIVQVITDGSSMTALDADGNIYGIGTSRGNLTGKDVFCLYNDLDESFIVGNDGSITGENSQIDYSSLEKLW